MTPQDPFRLIRKCKLLKIRIFIRCAGFLDFSENRIDFFKLDFYFSKVGSSADKEENNIFKQTIESSGSTEGIEDTADFTRIPSNQSYQSFYSSAVDGDVISIAGTQSEAGDSSSIRIWNFHGNSTLMPYYYISKIRYIHRKARDFLLDIEDG